MCLRSMFRPRLRHQTRQSDPIPGAIEPAGGAKTLPGRFVFARVEANPSVCYLRSVVVRPFFVAFLALTLVFSTEIGVIATSAAPVPPVQSTVQTFVDEATGWTCVANGPCTDGPTPPPSDYDGASDPAFVPAGTDSRAVCDGNGTSGSRFQVMYMYYTSDRYSSFLSSFQYWAKMADLNYQTSARRTGGQRYMRYVHDANCTISVLKVQVPNNLYNGSNGVFAVGQWLQNNGYNRSDRKYLVFLDDTDPGSCGIALKWDDDSSSLSNYNNRAPASASYASVALTFSDCWDTSTTFTHEATHTIGAVQASAPHFNSTAHCSDDYDVMCYDGYFAIVCPGASNNVLLDCNNDDYFHTNPPTGNYLKTHWNTANSDFLGRTLSTISLDKSSSKYNGWVTATMTGFTPGYYINLKWPSGTVLAQVKAGSDGRATAMFRTPLDPLGNYTVRASNSLKESAETTLRVIPRILLNETEGRAGSPLRVYFYGFSPGERIEVRFWNEAGTSSVKLITIDVASNGRGSEVVTVPTNTTVGDHKIVGSVIGVARSASTFFEVTALSAAEETSTPTPTSTASASATETVVPSATVPPQTPTEAPVTETATPELPTATATPELPTETATVEVPTETATMEIPTETPTIEAPAETPTVEPTV